MARDFFNEEQSAKGNVAVDTKTSAIANTIDSMHKNLLNLRAAIEVLFPHVPLAGKGENRGLCIHRKPVWEK